MVIGGVALAEIEALYRARLGAIGRIGLAGYGTGESVRVEPITGFVVYAVPHRLLTGKRLVVTVRAYDAHGRTLDEKNVAVTR